MIPRSVAPALGLVVATGALACGRPDSGSEPADLILANLTVIDGRGGPPMPGLTIEIRDGHIAAVRPARGGEASTIDLGGRFVVPGLIDSHVHLGQDAERLEPILDSLLRGGVTSVREMACCADLYQPLVSGADSLPMPRIFYSAFWAGPSFFVVDPRVSSTPGAGTLPWFLGVTDSTALPAAVTAAKASGVTGVKIYSNLPARLVSAITTEAHRQGLQVWSHPVVFPTRPSEVVAAGVDVVSHAALLVWEGAARVPETYDEGHPFNAFGPPAPFAAVQADAPAVLAVMRAMKTRGTILDATVSTIRRGVSEEAYAWAIRAAALAHGMGIPLAAGTDREHFVNGHPALLAELQALVDDVGLTPNEAIVAATRNGARAVGMENRLGTIEVGRIADLVVLRSDPSQQIEALGEVALVIKGGRPVGR